MSKWKSIETAPKDRPVWAYRPKENDVLVMEYYDTDYHRGWYISGNESRQCPSKWYPFFKPDPPEIE